MSMESDAKMVAILGMMRGFPSSKVSAKTIDSYLASVDKISAKAVGVACRMFLEGRVGGHENAFLPTAAELSSHARQIEEVIGETVADQRLAEIVNVVPYRIGEQPPPGMASLGQYEEQRRRHAEKMRKLLGTAK